LVEPTLPIHLRLRGKIDESTERLALQATLAATHLFGLATGTHLRRLRSLPDPVAELKARLEEAELRARLAWRIVEMLIERFSKIPERNRPYFTPAQRFHILEIRHLLAWSAREAARVFLLCPNTILNWERAADPASEIVGVTVKPTPPIRRAADVVRALAQTMARLDFGGEDLTSRILARAGWRVSARSVGRYRKERTVPPPAPEPTPVPKRNPVIARFVHHTWMMDVSHVKQLLGPDLFMATVFDAFSRVPLVLEVFDAKPGATAMAKLLRMAARTFGSPKYVITDLGKEFDAKAFLRAVVRLGALPRFASKENLYATARLERFWRTLKESARLYRLALPLTRADLERRLEATLTHYVLFRPHEGLKGATPAEAFLGITPACASAVGAPRGQPGQPVRQVPPIIEHLPGAERFPILQRAA
jgi:transposase InsO family protein